MYVCMFKLLNRLCVCCSSACLCYVSKAGRTGKVGGVLLLLYITPYKSFFLLCTADHDNILLILPTYDFRLLSFSGDIPHFVYPSFRILCVNKFFLRS